MAEINHERLDQVLSWAPQLRVSDTCIEEFNALRVLDKRGRAQERRLQHLEMHLDRGDVICECYEKNVRE